MNVDIDHVQRQRQEHNARRILAGNQLIAIGFFHRSLHDARLNIAPIDEKVLHGAIGPSGMCLGDIAPSRKASARKCGYLNKVCRHLLAEHREHRRNQFAIARRCKDLSAVSNHGKRNFGMGQCCMLNHTDDISCFGEILAQKLHTCRGIVKNISHNDGRTVRAASFLIFQNLACFQMQMHTCKGIRLLGEQINAGNRRDGCQRLTAKSQRSNRCQVILGSQLTSRMAAKRNGCVLR